MVAQPGRGLRPHHQQNRRAVAQARAVSSGDGSPRLKGRFQPAEGFQGGVPAGALVNCKGDRLPLALGDVHRQDLLGELAPIDGRDGALVAGQGKFVLFLTGDTGQLGEVLSGDPHRLGPIGSLQARVDETPAQGCVVGGQVAHRMGRLGQGVRRAAHALHAAHDKGLAIAGTDGAGSQVERSQTRGAQAVDRHPGHFNGQPCQQRGHAGNIAVILTGLVGAAQVDLFDQGGVQVVACYQGLDGVRGQVIRADGGQRAAQVADRGSERVDDHCFGHGNTPGNLGCCLNFTIKPGYDQPYRSGFHASNPLKMPLQLDKTATQGDW